MNAIYIKQYSLLIVWGKGIITHAKILEQPLSTVYHLNEPKAEILFENENCMLYINFINNVVYLKKELSGRLDWDNVQSTTILIQSI